jgi:hypothetical protein
MSIVLLVNRSQPACADVDKDAAKTKAAIKLGAAELNSRISDPRSQLGACQKS